ncbi:methyl-accepting chemotaxis protein [Haliea sp. E1-2-M8]|uniref:methyl-accepting chemotaxis protein n=1 Tax=Haliea sp. E1-2-M8 TaxID=3064706 RepID=UPI0027248FE6|nr:methyl-accepting chemotaxis protein [Haliea sp. E1-2-M8]MDO8860086.1 methyl-accepting chemotaxis protein [Haliea sp. E1-2-M8]
MSKTTPSVPVAAGLVALLVGLLGSIVGLAITLGSVAEASAARSVLLLVIAVLVLLLAVVAVLLWQARANDSRTADSAGITTALSRLAEGDLTAVASSDSPATGAIAEQLNTALERQRELVASIRSPFEGLVTELHKLGKNGSSGGERSAALGRELQDAGVSLAQDLRGADNLTTVSQQAREAMSQHRQLVNRGQGLAADMSRASTDVRESIQETSKSAKRQGELIQSVTTAAEYIQSLNTKISVVAINTRIEAERAGEHGRPFLGIAEAIGDLLREAEEEGRKITSEVRLLQNLSAENLNSLEHTVGAVVTVLDFVERIDGSLEDIGRGAGKLLDMVDSMATTTQQSAEAVRRMDALLKSVREQNCGLSDSAELMQQGVAALQQTLSTLGRSLARFRIDSHGATSVGSGGSVTDV